MPQLNAVKRFLKQATRLLPFSSLRQHFSRILPMRRLTINSAWYTKDWEMLRNPVTPSGARRSWLQNVQKSHLHSVASIGTMGTAPLHLHSFKACSAIPRKKRFSSNWQDLRAMPTTSDASVPKAATIMSRLLPKKGIS